MDFARLPDIVLVQIFQSLPLIDMIRAARVNRLFERISTLALTTLKSLELTKENLRGRVLDKDTFREIMDMCYGSVERIKLADWEQPKEYIWDHVEGRLVEIIQPNISRLVPSLVYLYKCPKLVDLDVRGVNVKDDDFEPLVKNYPNLRRLTYRGYAFPEGMVWEDLEYIRLNVCDEVTAHCFIDIVPNLRHLVADIICNPSDITVEKFFRSVPKLETLELRRIRAWKTFQFPKWVNLKSLFIDEASFTEAELISILRSFPRLQKLDLNLNRAITADTFDALRRLKDLRQIKLDSGDVSFNLDTEFERMMAECPKLRAIHMPHFVLGVEGFVNVFRNGNPIRQITLFGVRFTDTVRATMEMLEKCRQFGPKKIQIGLKTFQELIWGSKKVMGKLATMKEEDGVVIQVEKYMDA